MSKRERQGARPILPPAESAAVRFRPSPLVFVAVGGGVATGKSSVGQWLAERLDAVHVGSDEVRNERTLDGFDSFGSDLEAEIYTDVLRRADAGLAAGSCVVADGCFSLAEEREGARTMAVKHGAPFLFVECRASDEVLHKRLAERDAELDQPFWHEIAADLDRRSEPVVELPEDEHAVVRTDASFDDVLDETAARVRARRAQLSMPEAVTFDCWSTLLFEADWELAHAARVTHLREAAEAAGRPTAPDEVSRAFDAAWSRHMEAWRAGEASGAREVAHWSFENLGLRVSSPEIDALVSAFEEGSHSGNVCALDGARELLAALAAAGIPCALVCDTGLTPGRVVRKHLERLGLLEHLAVQAFSDEVGVPKPDPRIFRAALDPLGVAPEHALHVGDLRRTDVAGARSLAMRSVRLTDRYDDLDPEPEADFVVRTHAQLQKLLGLANS